MMQAALIVSHYPFGTSTILLNVVRMLRLRGVKLDIIIDSGSLSCAPWQAHDDGIRFITPEGAPSTLQQAKRLAQDILPPAVYSGLRFLWQSLCRWRRLKRKRTPHYAHAALEKAGLAPLRAECAAWADFAMWAGERVNKAAYKVVFFFFFSALFAAAASTAEYYGVYLNLELLDADDNDGTFKVYGNKTLFRSLEHAQLPKIHRVIAMSPRRREIFSETTGYGIDGIKVLPIMPLDGLRPRTGTYFRDLFGIPPETCLVLYSGGLGASSRHLELVQSVRHWPQNCALVMHCWHAPSFETEYGLALRKVGEGLPVYFSSNVLDYGTLCEAMTSADIGVAHYEDIDANFTEILFSSNKIGEYLCSGLPIICSPQAGLKRFVDEHGIGQALPVEQTPKALHAIQSNLEGYRQAVRRCVERHFDFRAWFEQALGDLLPEEKNT